MSGNLTTHHGHSPAYATPLLRVASPASSSMGTGPGADESDIELGPVAFERKCDARIGIYGLMDAQGEKEMKEREKEKRACGDPLLPTVKSASEEAALHERVLKNLRVQIALVEEDEEFERTLSTNPNAHAHFGPYGRAPFSATASTMTTAGDGSGATMEEEMVALRTSADLDVIMRSLMDPVGGSAATARTRR